MRCSAEPTRSSRPAAVSSTQSRSCTNAVLQRRRVPDDVGLPVAQHGPLGRAQAAHLDGEHDAEDQGDDRGAGSRHGHDALRGGQLVHVGSGYRRAQLVKMAMKSAVLLSVFSSPGTGSTSTVTGTFWPVGGFSVTGMVTVCVSPAAISAIVSSSDDGVAALAQRDLHVHVGLGVLALVDHLDVEGEVVGER